MSESHEQMSERHVACAIIAIAAITLPWLGLADFHTRGEAREAVVVQSMLSTGEWVLPRAYNEAIPSKPPLFHWLALAASIPLGAVTEFTARLPSTLAALGAVAFFVTFLKDVLSTRERLLFTLFLGFSFEWLRASVTARVDMVHAACLSTGLLSAFFALERGGVSWWAVASILLALATLGKGPVAIVLPAVTLTLWILTRREARLSRFVNVAACLSGALLVSLTWYLAAYLRTPTEFLNRVWYENVARFTGTMADEPHKHSVFFLLAMLLLGTLPWSPIGLWAVARRRPRSLEQLRKMWATSTPLVQFSVVSSVSVVAFYCIPSSKRGVYLLAAYPFLAVLSAVALRDRIGLPAVWKSFAVGSAFVLLTNMVLLPILVAPRTSERWLAAVITNDGDQKKRIYSFGFEFYGASFYARQLILRLEDSLEPVGAGLRRAPRHGDTVIALSPRLEEVEALLFRKRLFARPVRTLSLGGKEVTVIRVLNS